jgi:hypothetical protein
MLIMNLVIKSNECPTGIYQARFCGVEQTTHPEYGDGLRFNFEITAGPQKGVRTCRTTSAQPTPRNAAGRMLADLAGVAPANGVSLNPNDVVGKEYTIVVRESETGRVRVESVCALQADEEVVDVPF